MAQRSATRWLSSQVLIGALVVAVGVILLAETTGLYDTSFLFTYIPSLFVLLGLFVLVRSGFRNVFGPLLVVVVAGLWQLTALDVIEGADLVDFWPLFIVFFGLSLVFAHFRRRPEGVSDSHVTSFAAFGGSEKRSTSKQFTGADLTAVFGGAELDLRDAAVEDPPAHVSANVLFGGVEVVVPREWNVQLDVIPLFGGAADDRPRREEEHEGVDLVVSGLVLFGGVSVED
jgi:predicted membrane protein